MRDEDFVIVFPYLLKNAIRHSPYTQREIAHMIGISVSSMTRYLNGELDITVRDLNAILDILNIDANELIQPTEATIRYAKLDSRSKQLNREDRLRKRKG